MIIVLKPGTTKEQADELLALIEEQGLRSLYMPGSERTVLGALGDERVLAKLHFESHPQVESVKPILAPYKVVSREMHPHDTVVSIGAMSIGGDRFAVIAGPSMLESRERLFETAAAAKKAGARALFGGAPEPRPYAPPGAGIEGILYEVARELGLPAIAQVADAADVEALIERADAFAVGARNMHDARLLHALGGCDKPVVLERGIAATVNEWLLAAEHLVSAGNSDVVLCERGIRTFEAALRLDLGAVPYIKQKSHLPVLVDPAAGSGAREVAGPMARAAAACGADGILVAVHRDANAWSDGSLRLGPFEELVRGLAPFVEAAGKRL